MEEESEEEYDEEDSDEDDEDDDEDYEVTYEEEAPSRPGVRHGCLKALALILMTAIAVMLLIITMKIKGLIP